jgi:Bacteriophage protein gp37
MKPAWVERIKKQCHDQEVRFFFKQWGGCGADGIKRSKKANGRLLLGKTWNDMPNVLPSSQAA